MTIGEERATGAPRRPRCSRYFGNTPLIYWLPALITAAVIFYLSHRPDLAEVPTPIPDWGLHLLEYGFFTVTLVFATTRGFEGARRTRGRLVAAVLIAVLYGVTDEIHQGLVGRDAALNDLLADAAGALLTAAAIMLRWSWMAAPERRL